MRYREAQTPAETGSPVPYTDDFVALTVWLTLLIGIVFVAGGIWGRQRWLLTWGVFTLIACAIYFAWPLLRPWI